jgi:hypothetical protein
MSEGEREILADWSRLGMLWNVPASARTPDVEALMVQSLQLIRQNPRMLVLLCSWLAIFWRCVGRDRLLQLARGASPEDQATLGIMLATADQWIAPAVFASRLRHLEPLAPPRPLLDADRDRPALARLARLEASSISRSWGLWSLPVQQKPEAIRPVSWVQANNPLLRTRALFKGSLKTSLLASITAARASQISATDLARQCGVTRKAVYDALEDLRFAGLLPGKTDRPGNRRQKTPALCYTPTVAAVSIGR